MSISLLLAVTMMIGTRVRVRSSRHTSIPDFWGNQMSSRTRSGRTRSNMAEPLDPVAGDGHEESLPLQPDHQGLDERLLVLDDQHRERFRQCVRPLVSDARTRGDRHRRQAEDEGGSLSLDGVEPGPCRRGWRPHAGRSKARGRCRPWRGTGPDRPGRTVRRFARRSRAGIPTPSSSTEISTPSGAPPWALFIVPTSGPLAPAPAAPVGPPPVTPPALVGPRAAA